MSERPTPETDAEWDRLQMLPGGGYSSQAAGVKLAFGMTRWASELERQRDEWKERFIAFAIFHCTEYGRQHYGENCLHFTHYDVLQEAGARMVDFKRCGEVKQ